MYCTSDDDGRAMTSNKKRSDIQHELIEYREEIPVRGSAFVGSSYEHELL
jgi:hypothetical protein